MPNVSVLALILSLIMSSLSWAWDGDIEAQLLDHPPEIHSSGNSSSAIKNSTAISSEMAAVSHDIAIDGHEHHCSLSAHLMFGLSTAMTLAVLAIDKQHSFSYQRPYLSYIPEVGLRPPIS